MQDEMLICFYAHISLFKAALANQDTMSAATNTFFLPR